ncbi:MAG: GDSL-type esterase/lipase family protein [Steroidobacteraceae bacterium]
MVPDITVACVGSSSTAGKGQAFNWVGELEQRPQNRRFAFRNFGIGGDLSFNVLERLPQVLDCRPRIVVVAVGNNDVLALASAKARRFFRIFKRLPHDPSAAWFRENFAAIARGLKSSGRATVALCSLPPIGEDPNSEEPFQREINRRSGQLNAMIKDIAQEESVGYIGLNEAMNAQLATSPPRALTAFRFFPLYRDAFRTLALHKTPDQVAELNGWCFHSDGIHLNSRGGLILADLVQAFIDDVSSRPSG